MSEESEAVLWDQPQDVDDVTMAFPAMVIGTLMPEYDSIPEEFKKQYGPWQEVIAAMFYEGGRWPEVKEGLDAVKVQRHLGCCLGSYQPKHEHKLAACSWLASLWFASPTKGGRGCSSG